MRARAQIRSHPIHPMLVGFPIGLWVTSLAFDIFGVATGHPSVWHAGFFCIIAGCFGAAAAAFFGAVDLFSVVPPRSSARSRGYTHALLNVLTLAIFIFVAWRRGIPGARPDALSLVISAAGVCVLAVSGWLGATLVYRNQIGVDHRYANAGKWHERTVENWSRPVCGENELSNGQMMLIHVGAERVVVGRCAEGMVAFSDRCTHKGGPLSDGVLAGCTVQCPWHGSQFDVHTGRVVAGPADEPVRTYSAEVRGTEVYVTPITDLPKAA